MTLKIIHHRENQNVINENKCLNLEIENCLIKMFNLCQKIIDFSSILFDKIDINVENNICNFDEKYQQLQNYLNMFSLIVGNKVSILDAINKATLIMHKIQIIAEKFGISLINENDNNIEYLTDEDIDIMVQLVKDFGEQKIREDVKEYNKEIKEKKQIKENKKTIDIYDIYHLKNEKEN